MQKFSQAFRFNRGYWPSQQVVGDPNETVFAGENIVFRGGPQNVYAEAFRGSELRTTGGGTLPMAKVSLGLNVDATLNSTELQANPFGGIGAGTIHTKVQKGQIIQIGERFYLVTRIVTSNAINIAPAFQDTSGTYAVFSPRIPVALNGLVALMPGSGNAVSLPKGHVLTTGGKPSVQFLNDPVLQGGAGALGPGIATTGVPTLVFGPGMLTAITLGLAAPTLTTVASVAGGTKQTPVGKYSVRIARGRLETAGYGNPSEAVEVEHTVVGQKIRITFPSPLTSQSSWRVYGTLYSVSEYRTGPWYEVAEVTTAQVTTGGGGGANTFDFEWRDWEIAGSQLVAFDNDVPPLAQLIAYFGGSPIAIGAAGSPPQDIGGLSISPGPSMFPAKSFNPEGFPTDSSLAVGPVQDIVGYVEAEGRLYLVTSDYVHIVTLTGNPIQPLTVRPFVQSSFARRDALVFVEGVLYGFGPKGPVRITGGEGLGEEDQVFAAPIRELTATWSFARVCVAYDPSNEAIVFFHANDAIQDGFWTSAALMYHLPLNCWSTPIRIKEAGQHMNVTGACSISGRCVFVANEVMWLWDAGTVDRPWWVATPHIDQGAEGTFKNIRRFSATYRAEDGYAAIYGNGPTEAVPIAPLQVAGSASSKTGSLPLPNTTDAIVTSRMFDLNVRDMRLYAVKVGGIDKQSSPRDRVEEILVRGNIHVPER